MLENDKLQEIFDAFGLSLREYIKEEVKRQVNESMSSMEVEEEEAGVVGVATGTVAAAANVPAMDIQASLDQLAELASSAKDSVAGNTVLDDLVSNFGNSSSDGAVELGMVGAATEEMSAPVTDQQSGFSVLQGLVDKIRQRKNIANN